VFTTPPPPLHKRCPYKNMYLVSFGLPSCNNPTLVSNSWHLQVELVLCEDYSQSMCVSIGNAFTKAPQQQYPIPLHYWRCKKTLLQQLKKLKEVGQSLYAICLQFFNWSNHSKMSTQSTPNFICKKWTQSFD